ncbi:MAG: hypothetical protein Q9224_002920 [Gallowayella concinna]
MTQLFTSTAVLLPAGETTEDHKQSQKEEARLVEKDKANHGTGGGLFNGRFRAFARFRPPIRDAGDGVDRCPRCTWELERGMCNSCGYTIHALNDIAYLDDQSMSSDAPSYTSSALEELLSNDGDFADFLDVDEDPRHDFRDHIRQRAGLSSSPHHRRISHRSGAETSDDYDDDSTDGSASVGSLRDFLADDMAVDDADADAESGNSSDANPRMNTYDSGSEGLWNADEHGPSSPGADRRSDTNSTTIPPRRFRRRRVALSSPDPSESDLSDSTHPYWPTSQQPEDYAVPGGFSPLQSEPDGGHSQDVPIQIDSDSDVPIVRHRRKRPTTLSVSSDSEDNGAQGVNISHRRDSGASSDGTARNHNHSSASSVARCSRPSASTNNSDSRPSAIMVDSSPARPNFPSHFQSPRPSANRLSRPTASDFFEDDSVYDYNGTDNRLGLESSRNTPTAPSDLDERLRSRIARMREQSEQRVPQSAPQRHNLEERKRLKMQRRARAQQERASRVESNHRVHPQRLAYIDV